MRIAICTALDNGVGLTRDYELLKRLAESAGHDVTGVHFRRPKPRDRFDLVVFLEVFDPAFLDLAPVAWCLPNPEWFFHQWIPHLPAFQRVLCKTRDAVRIFDELGARTRFTGFMSEDRRDLSVPRRREFLHVAGDSLLKGTAAIIEAWERYAIPHPLTIVSRRKLKCRSRSVKVLRRVSAAVIQNLQNRCTFNLAPSQYEGWGHVIHEALSCGAVVATTDAPPMSDFDGVAMWVGPVTLGQHNLAQLASVSAEVVRDAVDSMWSMSEAQVAEAGRVARAAYERRAASFAETFTALLQELAMERSVPAPVPVVSSGAGGPRLAICFPMHPSGGDLLLRSLLALKAQTAPPELFEVVVAGDGCTTGDMLPYIPRQATDFHITLTASPRPHGDQPHRNHARNAAWRAARAPLCWMLDQDFLLPPHTVEHVLAEHDASLARGLPAVLTPTMTALGGTGPEDWRRRSADWVESEDADDFRRLLAEWPEWHHGVYSGFPERYVPGPPLSETLPNLPEGMPILWRGLLESMGGFDESFFGWGGDKEELIDRLKGLQAARLIDIRLLRSVLAIHQPHGPDPFMRTKDAKQHQREREARARRIQRKAPWWMNQLKDLRASLPGAVAAARP